MNDDHIAHAKCLTVSDHAWFDYEEFSAFITVCSRYNTKSELNVFSVFYFSSTFAGIHQSQSYYKWFETKVNLLVKVGKRYLGEFYEN